MALERKDGVGVAHALLEEGPGSSRVPISEDIIREGILRHH
jgi:hypothetical protein